MIVYAVRHLLPITTPPVTDAAVAVEGGRIVAAGRRKDVLKAAGTGAEVRDLGDGVVLPGPVNAHTHLDRSWFRDDPPPDGSYAAWLSEVAAREKTVAEPTAREAAAAAIREMVSRGVAAVGDAAWGAWTAPLLARSPLRAVVFLQIRGFRSTDAERLLDEAASRLDAVESDPGVVSARGRCSVVLSPESVHAASPALLKALAGRAAATGELLSIHVAETEDEVSLLRDGSGPLAEVLREAGCWDEGWRPPGLSPVEHLDRLGVLSPRTLAVHCIHVGHQDLSKLQARGVAVVTCPRSNLRLGSGKTPVPRLLASGIPVALGTESLAAAPDLDLFAEMAALRREHPGLAPAAVLRMATLNGARALQLDGEIGTIEPGKHAVLAVVPLDGSGDDPLEVVTSGAEGVTRLEEIPPAGAAG